VPEPWATRLVEEGGGHVLVNEKDLWTDTDGQFVTTHLLVAHRLPGGAPGQREGPHQRPARRHRRSQRRRGHRPGTTNDGIEKITTKRLADGIIAGAWGNLTFTADPVAASLEKSKDDAVAWACSTR
jgi:NitT/TauT family transport system substrate-binding protein